LSESAIFKEFENLTFSEFTTIASPSFIDRKKWLFSATPRGAHASASIYSLIETAKANGAEPYAYLREVFAKLTSTSSDEELQVLLPWNV
jgi:transposase